MGTAVDARSDAPPAVRRPVQAALYGCGGATLGEQEIAFFREYNPLGLILFQRNCESREQVRSLVDQFRAVVGRPDAPVLIDQEGGRVARLKPPVWRRYPAAGQISALYRHDRDRGMRAAYLKGRLIGDDLAELGISVDCAPVADLHFPGAHDIIGDRSYGADVETAGELCRAMAAGLLDSGVLPVVKHIPGHGRAKADSHLELPVVDASRPSLDSSDFAVFRYLSDLPWAMTAHIVYSAYDRELPCTLSERMVRDVIRREIGFGGVLVSDDLSMKALGGTMADRARGAIAAGCDVVLHCNGDMTEMVAVAAGTPHLSQMATSRITRAEDLRIRAMGRPERPAFDRELDSLLGETSASA